MYISIYRICICMYTYIVEHIYIYIQREIDYVFLQARFFLLILSIYFHFMDVGVSKIHGAVV